MRQRKNVEPKFRVRRGRAFLSACHGPPASAPETHISLVGQSASIVSSKSTQRLFLVFVTAGPRARSSRRARVLVNLIGEPFHRDFRHLTEAPHSTSRSTALNNVTAPTCSKAEGDYYRRRYFEAPTPGGVFRLRTAHFTLTALVCDAQIAPVCSTRHGWPVGEKARNWPDVIRRWDRRPSDHRPYPLRRAPDRESSRGFVALALQVAAPSR